MRIAFFQAMRHYAAELKNFNFAALRRIRTIAKVNGGRQNGGTDLLVPFSLRNADTDLLVPFMKTSNGQKAFSFSGAKIWNELSHEAKQAPSLSSFKNKIKSV